VSGLTVNQVVLGSSANPGLRDFWIVSEIIKERDFPEISFDVNPSSQVLENLMEMGL
jgi:aconitate hydratase